MAPLKFITTCSYCTNKTITNSIVDGKRLCFVNNFRLSGVLPLTLDAALFVAICHRGITTAVTTDQGRRLLSLLCLSVCLSICMTIDLMSVWIYLFLCPFVSVSLYLSASVCLSLSVCLCLSVFALSVSLYLSLSQMHQVPSFWRFCQSRSHKIPRKIRM